MLGGVEGAVTYTVKSIFDTFQGEGALAGERALFVRFAGCNLWTGRPQDRDKGIGACARWCDTSFVGGAKYATAELLVDAMDAVVTPAGPPKQRLCVLTGGEPALQINEELIDVLIDRGWRIAVETNGTIDNRALRRVDWLTCSPKIGGEVVTRWASEVKVVLPGVIGNDGLGWTDALLDELRKRVSALHYFVIPMDPPNFGETEDTLLHPRRPALVRERARQEWEENVARCVAFVRSRPGWRIGAQAHKAWGLP